MVRAVPDVGAYVRAHAVEWQELFQSLLAQRSVFEEEHGIIEIVARRIEGLGLEVVRVPHDAARLATLPGAQRPFSSVPGRCSLVTRVPGHGDGRSLAYNVHLDIVPEGDPTRWTQAPFGGTIVDGAIYGRGAMDDKAGVTIALATLETLVRTGVPPAGDVVFQFVLEDETTGNGSLLCLDAGHGADAAVIIDGTRPDRAIDCHAGQLQFDIHVTGKPAPVSVSHLGVNAADLVARLVARLADAVAALNPTRSGSWTLFPSPFQLVTQRLASDGVQLTVPDRADATCYMTFVPPWTLDGARTFLRRETAAFAGERHLDALPVLDFHGFEAEPVASDAALLTEVLSVCAAGAGYGPIEVGPSTGTSDMRHFVGAGVRCVLYGPGPGFNPHRPDEHYRLEDLPRMVGLFVALAHAWSGGDQQDD